MGRVPRENVALSATAWYGGGQGGMVPLASTITPASDAGAVSGDFYVETQELEVVGVRSPQFSLSSTNVGLSALTVGYKQLNTQLLCKVKATVKRSKVSGIFPASALQFQQTQKFGVDSTSAIDGISYGDVSGPDVLGPAFTLNTIEPWYYRRPWNDANDVEETQSMEYAANFYMGKQPPLSPTIAYLAEVETDKPQTGYMYDFKNQAVDSREEGSLVSDAAAFLLKSGGAYMLPGSYSTDQETQQGLISFIEFISQQIKNTYLHSIPPNAHPTLPWLALNDQGVPLYDSTKHEYN